MTFHNGRAHLLLITLLPSLSSTWPSHRGTSPFTTHFWMSMLATLGAFIECKNRSDFPMGASTLYKVVVPIPK
jgi:hypothetical protein